MRRASMAAAPQGQLTRSEVDDCLNPYACIIAEWSCVLSWGVSREGQAGARDLNSWAFQNSSRRATRGSRASIALISLARASPISLSLATVSESALGGPLPGERGLAPSFFLSALASRFSRATRVHESLP